jgi:hypothetical protein
VDIEEFGQLMAACNNRYIAMTRNELTGIDETVEISTLVN